MKKTFVEIVQDHFQFLIKDFGFGELTAEESPRGEQWEGVVKYSTEKAYIVINCTRGEFPSLWLGRARDKDDALLPIQVIYEYMSLSNEEKKIVLTTLNARQAARILREKQLINIVPKTDHADERKELQLVTYARWLSEYALPILRGDFSQWLAIWEYHVGKLTAENIRAGRPEFVPIVITDDNGQLKVIGKQPVFKKALDYIQKLRNEHKTTS